MTDTATRVVYDRSFVTENSGVIDSVYYASGDKELYVLLHTGAVCGYSDVPKEIFSSLKLTEESSGSVGSYWNRFVKDHFPGINTEGVELLSEEEAADEHRYEPLPAPFDGMYADKPSPDWAGFWSRLNTIALPSAEQTEIAPVTRANFGEFIVNFESSDVNDNEFYLLAADEADALVRFNQIADIAGWEDIKILSLTHVFS